MSIKELLKKTEQQMIRAYCEKEADEAVEMLRRAKRDLVRLERLADRLEDLVRMEQILPD